MHVTLSPLDVALPTGERLRVREIRAGDRALIAEGFEQLSEESRYFRFLSAHPRLTDRELDRFAALNDEDHFVIGALLLPNDADGPVGIARYVRDPETPSSAEFAVTIVDAWQGRGIGQMMLTVLAEHAAQNGITTFTGDVAPDNRAMLGLMGKLGAEEIVHSTSEIEVSVPVTALKNTNGRLHTAPVFMAA